MKLSSNCFNDSELKGIIDSINNEDICDIYGISSEHIYDTEKHSELIPYFESLIGVYTPTSESDIEIDKSKTLRLKYDILENWDIFKSDITHEKAYLILKNICHEKYAETPELFDDDIIIEELYDNNYKKNHSLLKIYTWAEFTNSLIKSNRYHTNHFNEEILKLFCSIIKKHYKTGQRFYRGRVSKKEGIPKDEMGAPKFEYSRDGRANASGVECLYLASEIDTTINEVRAGKSDYITIGTFELQQDITIVDLKRIDKISPFAIDENEIPLVDYAINKKFLKKINEEMGKVIRKNDSRLDYIPTQYISDYIKSLEINSTGMYSGIEYNSTICSSGYNLAIFYPNLFKCVETNVYEVSSLVYDYKKIS